MKRFFHRSHKKALLLLSAVFIAATVLSVAFSKEETSQAGMSWTTIVPAILSAGLGGMLYHDRRSLSDERQVEPNGNNTLLNPALFNLMPDLLFLIDHKGVIYDYHSPSPDQLLVHPSELVGKDIFSIRLPEETVSAWKRAIDTTFETGKLHTIEYHVQTADSSEKWFESRLQLVRQDRILALVRDITAQKKVEAELHGKREVFEKAFHGSGDARFIVHLVDHTILEANRTFVEWFGFSADVLQGKQIESIEPVACLESFTAVLEDMKRSPERKTFRSSLDCIAGKTRICDGRIGPVTIHDEACAMVTLRDVTEQTRAQEALEEKNRQLQLLLRTTRSFQANRTVEEVIEGFLATGRELLGNDCGLIGLRQNGSVQTYKAAPDSSGFYCVHTFNAGEGLPGIVLQSGQSLSCKNTRNEID
ncbi:PAS domain S-box protein, partial [bacterium]|nr:PAS domain S-box protein [bacterium]